MTVSSSKGPSTAKAITGLPKKSVRSVQLVGVGSTTSSLARQCWRSVSRGRRWASLRQRDTGRVVAVAGAVDDPVHHAVPAAEAPAGPGQHREPLVGEVGAPEAVEQLAQEPVDPAQDRVELGPAPGDGVHVGQPVGVGEAEQGGRLQDELLLVAQALGRRLLGQVGQVVEQAVELEDDAPGVGGVVDEQVDRPGHLHGGTRSGGGR